MDNTNKIFRLSLTQDLQKLNQIITELPKDTQKLEDITSWFFPTKNYMFVEEFINTKKIVEHGSDKLLLELIIDRLYIGIKLLLEEIRTSSIRKLVFSPKQVTLGNLFGNLCQRILEMNQCKTANNFTEESCEFSKINKESQTDISSLNKCDSCASAIMCMKNLMNVFKTTDSDYLTEVRRFKPQILDITQFGSMLQITTTVIDNFKNLNEKIYNKEAEIRNIKQKKQDAMKEVIKMERQITHLQEEVRMYKTEYGKSTQKITQLSCEMKELNISIDKKKLRIKQLETIVEYLNKMLDKKCLLIRNLEKKDAVFDKILQNAISHQKVLLQTAHSLSQNMEKISGNIGAIGERFAQFEEAVDLLNGKLSNISKINENTKLKLISVTCDMKQFSEDSILEFRKMWNERKREFLEKTAEKSGINVTQSYQIKGNPAEDITNQIQENEAKITGLRLENEKLVKILEKFQLLRTI